MWFVWYKRKLNNASRCAVVNEEFGKDAIQRIREMYPDAEVGGYYPSAPGTVKNIVEEEWP